MPSNLPPKPSGKHTQSRKPRGPKLPPRKNYPPLSVPLLDAFSQIGVGITKGYQLVNQGRIKTFYTGRRRYAVIESLEQLLESGA
jgi:hypothetical protein